MVVSAEKQKEMKRVFNFELFWEPKYIERLLSKDEIFNIQLDPLHTIFPKSLFQGYCKFVSQALMWCLKKILNQKK